MNGVKGGVEAMSVEKGAKGFQVWWRCWLFTDTSQAEE